MTAPEAPTKPRLFLKSGNGYAILMSAMDVAEKSGWSLKEWRAFSRKFRSGTWEDGFSLVCERFDVHLASSFSAQPSQWVAEQSETPPLEFS